MEDQKKGTRKRIVRRPSEGHAEKVDYSTSRSFDSEDRPRRAFGSSRPRSDRPYGDRPHSDRPHTDRPHTDRPHSDRPRTERSFGD